MKRKSVIIILSTALLTVLMFGACDSARENFGSSSCAPPSASISMDADSSVPQCSENVSSAADSGSEVSSEPVTSEGQKDPEGIIPERLLESMTLYEKLCQMLIISPESLTGTGIVTAAGENTKNALGRFPVGGLLYSKPNFVSKEQVGNMLGNVQRFSKIPLILTCDEEGGRVNRLMSSVGTTYVGPMLSYRDEGPQRAYSNAFTIATDMKSLGFNADMAPVADVWSNPENTVIGDRAYSDDFSEAAKLIEYAVKGFHDGGVATALKHFPGHGDTSADSHEGAVYVEKSLAELMNNELIPFRAGIEAGSDMVMIGHLIVREIDDAPATFSYKIVTELLRGEFGYDGVVITDSLQMGAMTEYYTSGETAVRAVKAGVDILLCPENPFEAVDALEKAVRDGEIPETRIDKSVMRILTMKKDMGLFD